MNASIYQPIWVLPLNSEHFGLGADKAAMPINRCMIFIPKRGDRNVALADHAIGVRFGLREFHGPTSINVFLRRFGRLVSPDLISRFAFLDCGLLTIPVTLLRGCDQRGVHDLHTLGKTTGLREMLVEPDEQIVGRTRLNKMLPEQLDRICVRDPVTMPQNQEQYE